jgi:hypothetical protein
VIIAIHVIVKKYAIGSLLPLSSSSIGLRLFFKPRLLDLNIEKTAAASVEETIEPNKRASQISKTILGKKILKK